MQFSRLRLVGFKSFADVAELVIEPGLTGLVGPNGCGKSNLAEALRWVMGESSYKTMRAARGEEVIFAGTAGAAGGRPAAGFAEVTLYLDNSDFSAPPKFNAGAELSIARHISRDGFSQYRINGREARAKDVQLLLADQSSGAHSSAQVGQGRVGALIEARPQARRILLEEAAGIGGLQMRREAAESRLGATDGNLARLSEILAVLSERLAALSAQAEQAAQFKRFSAEIRRLELMSHRLKLRETSAAARAAETALNEQTALLAEKHERQLRLARAAAARADALEAAEIKRAERAAANSALAQECAACENERQGQEAKARSLAENLKQLAADFAREQARRERGKALRQAKEAELAALAKQALPARQALAKQALAAAKQRAEALERAFKTAREQRAQAEAQARERQNAARFYAEMRARQGEKQRQLAAKRAAAEETAAGLAAAHETAEKQLAAAREDCKAQEERAARAERRLSEAAGARQAAALACAQKEQAFSAAEAELKALRQIAAEFDAAQTVESGGASVLALSSAEKGYEAAFAAALGEAAAGGLSPACPLYWREMPSAAESRPLPPQTEPLRRFVRAPAALARLLAQTAILPQSGDGQKQQRALLPGQILVSLAGDVWRWDGFRKKAGAKADIYTGYLQRKRQIDEQSASLAEQRRAEAQAREALRLREAAALEAERAAQAARQALAGGRDTLSEAEGEARRAAASQRESTVLRRSLAQAQAEIEADLLSQGAPCGGGEADTEPQKLAALEQAEAEAESACEEARNAWLTLQAALQADEKQRLAQAGQQQNLRRELAAHKAEEEQSQAYLAELARRRIDAERAADTLEKTARAAQKRHKDLFEVLAQAEEAARAAERQAREAAALQSGAANAARQAERELNAAREARSRLEEKLAAAQSQAREAEAAARAYCGARLMPPDGEEEEKLSAAAQEATALQLRQKRAQREQLGAVNLRAEEESAALRQRYDSLKAETDDIAAARDKLREAIADLNREGRARLRKAFAEVNARFAHLFQRLFGSGGAAELQWVESEEDPLDIGLEIAVRPPGKKQQNISLLSGGEQSLTALALIFAVFLSNPAPLCLLDEVDAPLDDYNVERFCRLLREMTGLTKTRFLVISHNPISMAQMDRLFGVTMIERGVSSLVSVDLRAAAALADKG